MYQRYSEAAGLRILGFPCNQFGGQEPGTEAEVKEFATGKYNVTFDMFSKINVNGGDAHPLWVYLKVTFIIKFRVISYFLNIWGLVCIVNYQEGPNIKEFCCSKRGNLLPCTCVKLSYVY